MAQINLTDFPVRFHTNDTNWLFPVSLIVSIICILMQCMMIHAVFKRCDWQNTRYYIWMSLAIADLIVAILPVFFLPVLYTSSNSSTVETLIKVVDFCLNLGITSSSLNVMLLSLHRYFYCLRPFLSARLLTKNKAICSVCVSWILAATFSTGNLFSKPMHFNRNQLILIVLKLSTVIQYCITIASSLFVVTFVQCQLLIFTLKKLKNEQLQRRVVARQNVTQSRRTERRLIPMIVIILMHLCMFVPFLVALTLLTIGYDETVLNNIINLTPFLSPFINSIIYGLQLYEVRRGIKKDLREIKRCILGGRLNQIEAVNTTTRKTSRFISFSYKARVNDNGMPQLSEKEDDNNNNNRISEKT